jgi:hypothetical protein
LLPQPSHSLFPIHYFQGATMVRQSFKSRTGALKPAVGLALAATSLLALSACSDPGGSGIGERAGRHKHGHVISQDLQPDA